MRDLHRYRRILSTVPWRHLTTPTTPLLSYPPFHRYTFRRVPPYRPRSPLHSPLVSVSHPLKGFPMAIRVTSTFLVHIYPMESERERKRESDSLAVLLKNQIKLRATTENRPELNFCLLSANTFQW